MHDIQITTVAELNREELVGARVAGVELVAVAVEDKIQVFDGRCPHQGTLLSEGSLGDGTLICRHFDIIRSKPQEDITERFVFTVMPQDLQLSLRPRMT